MTAAEKIERRRPRFAGVPTWLLVLTGLVLLGTAAYLIYSAFDQWQTRDDCIEGGLVPEDECRQLHGDLGTEMLIGGIAAVCVLLILLAALALIGRRDWQRRLDTDEETLADDEQGEAPVRVCPVCSAQSQTFAETCPHCGSSFIRARRVRARRRLGGMSLAARVGMVATVVLIPLALGAVAWAVTTADDRQSQADNLAAVELERREEAEAARAAERKREADQAERQLRSLLVKDLEESITKDAQQQSEKPYAFINGPILATQCDPDGGQIDIDTIAQDFNCLAIRRYNGDGTISGYRYSATVNYKTYRYTWRYGGA